MDDDNGGFGFYTVPVRMIVWADSENMAVQRAKDIARFASGHDALDRMGLEHIRVSDDAEAAESTTQDVTGE